MNKALYIKISGYIFTVVALVHLLTLVYGWQAQIGGWVAPMWLSLVAVVAAGWMAYTAMKMKQKGQGERINHGKKGQYMFQKDKNKEES